MYVLSVSVVMVATTIAAVKRVRRLHGSVVGHFNLLRGPLHRQKQTHCSALLETFNYNSTSLSVQDDLFLLSGSL